MKRKAFAPTAIIALITFVMALGCSSSTAPNSPIQIQPSAQAVSQNPPANISEFSSVSEGTQTRFYFMLQDANGANTISDGTVKLEIFDDLNNALLSQPIQFSVRASQYVDYQFKLTGQSLGKAYEWRITTTDIRKGVSSFGWGRAVLTFVTTDGRRLTSENKAVQIPTYTQDELTQMAEGDYTKAAKTVSLVAQDDKLQVTLSRLGYFNNYSSLGGSSVLLRADLTVVSKGQANFFASSATLIDSTGRQYDASYQSKFDSGQLQPNVTRTGYIAFENIPKSVQISSITVGDYVFDFSANRAYTVGQFAEETYVKSAISVNQEIAKGNFDVTVSRVGFFTSNSILGSKEYFRVDMIVKNIGATSEYFSPSGMAILDNKGSQYKYAYGGTLDTLSQIYPGVKQGGYVLFEGVPKIMQSAKIVFQLGRDAQYKEYSFEYALPSLPQ